MPNIETWFIPFDILMIIFTTLVMILSILFIFIIVLDKTCHTVPMMLVANLCLATFVFACGLITMCVFTLENDLKQIEYEDSLCIVRAYFVYFSSVPFHYSTFLQAIHRYIVVVYPNRLFLQSARFQFLLICSTWILGLLYPLAFMFNGVIEYIIHNQICQIPLQSILPMMYAATVCYTSPISMTMFIYFKLVRYVRAMGKHITPVNTLHRAQRELKMVQRTVILVTILLILGLPYALFVFIAIFTSPPKYHFRIAYLFIDVSLPFVMIALFKFTDPLKESVMKKIKRQPNTAVAEIISMNEITRKGNKN